ncbi:MAG: CHASE2 domain-containing protein [Proteobacteria bacterium]|nr:CHASE2 domain-containing protein [Pseudomonadota bacterium]
MKHFAAELIKSRAILIPVVLISATMLFRNTDAAKEVRERLVAPAEFGLRRQAGRTPELSDKLKVIVYGDRAKSQYGVQELIPLPMWASMIESVASRKPAAIIFDKFFSLNTGPASDAENFNRRLAALKTPVIAAAAFGGPEVANNVFPPRQFAEWTVDTDLQIRRGKSEYLLGPHPSIRESFHKIGSIEVIHTSTIQPLWYEETSGRILPHLSFSFAKKSEFADNIIRIDDAVLFTDRFGRLPVNFFYREAALKNTLPASPFFKGDPLSPTISKINKDDIVLILPSMYTGSTDFKDTPVGRLEGGFYHMSLINSVLVNSAIRPVLERGGSFLTCLLFLAFVSSALATRAKIRTGLAGIIGCTVSLVITGFAFFIFGSIQFDWHVLSSFTLLNGGTLLALRIIKEDRQIQQIESTLQGMVPEAVLKSVMNQPELVRQRPNELNLTVMFIDIEGFSKRTKSMMPSDVFRILHAQIDRISSIIHSNGGVVDRILGDGVMAYFGYNFDHASIAGEQDHAYRALRCAAEIQRDCVQLLNSTTNHQSGSGTFIPLRIGLNTGDLFFGNLGSGKRIDLTVVGHTVNMAKRLEDACETFKVLFSTSTYEHMKQAGRLGQLKDVTLHQRNMTVKHEDQLVTAWECDPFAGHPEDYAKALKLLRQIDNVPDTDFTSLKHPCEILINGRTSGILQAFSGTTALMSSPSYFCRKVFLNIEIRLKSETAGEVLQTENLKIISMQVQTGSVAEDGAYIHTLKIQHFSKDRIQRLTEIINSV